MALFTLAAVVVTVDPDADWLDRRFVAAARLLLVPLGATIVGLVRERYWGRWLGLAGALAVLPWALVLTFAFPGGPPVAPAVALAASLLLLVSLTGRTMFERYDTGGATDWTGRRMGLVRWTVILNVASALGLVPFVSTYPFATGWHAGVAIALLITLLAGVLLLARQRTAGLLLVAASCVLFLPAGAYFVWTEARYASEALLFAAAFLPGVGAGWACLFAFGKPIWRMLKG